MIDNEYRPATSFSYQENQIHHDRSKQILRKISVGTTPTKDELDLLDRITTASSSSMPLINFANTIAQKNNR